MLTFLIVVVATIAAPANAGEVLTACQLSKDAALYRGTTVLVQSAITIGPHDEYLVADHCAAGTLGTDYIFLSYDQKEPSVKRLVRRLRKQAKQNRRAQVMAMFSGTLEIGANGKYGAIGANKKLTVVHVEHMSIKNL